MTVRFPTELILITHTPQPTIEVTPTPTYAALPTIGPPDICVTTTPKGQVCTQPLPPLPTSTPIAVCPAPPEEPCVYFGGEVRWLTTTPEPRLGSP
jgi:hypothetical protein